MVGVPGKYKGCETCRLRRVKCDNQRPFCKKCVDGGRQCAGYERETVFIIGTIEDQGRCSSHPPRVVKPKKGQRVSKGDEEGIFELAPTEPLRPAWDDLISASCRGRNYRLQTAALHTNLQTVTRGATGDGGDEVVGGNPVFVSLPPYAPLNVDVQPSLGEHDFQLASQCLVHLATPDDEQGVGTQTTTDNICLFLYEHNTASSFTNQPHWKDPSVQTNNVRRLGPDHFRAFPAHHFFVRVYRPNAIMTSLLNRTPTFLAEPQWLSTPFESHPKSALDRLFDLLARLPSLLARADRILAQEHTFTRRLMAQDLLLNCLDLETDMNRWYASLSQQQQQQQQQQPPFWLSNNPLGPDGLTTTLPFPTATTITPLLSFRDNPTALALAYYWTSLVPFYPTIWHLYFAAVLDPIVVVTTNTTNNNDEFLSHQQEGVGGVGGGGGGGGILTPLPPRLQTLDPMQYSLHKVRDAAGNGCGAMAFLLDGGWVQPDLLWHGLFVVGRFYGELGGLVAMGSGGGGGGGVTGLGLGQEEEEVGDGDGRVELMWCEGFRERLVARGREMREVVLGRVWVDLAAF